MNPIEVFGSGACAVTLLFCASFGMMREINRFVDRYPPLDYAGDGTPALLFFYTFKGFCAGLFFGGAALFVAACLAVEFGVVA